MDSLYKEIKYLDKSTKLLQIDDHNIKIESFAKMPKSKEGLKIFVSYQLFQMPGRGRKHARSGPCADSCFATRCSRLRNAARNSPSAFPRFPI